MREKTHAGEVYTTRDVINRFHSVPGPGHGFGQKCTFQSLKTPLSFSKNEFAHYNQRGSKYKIRQKSQIRKFRFSSTLNIDACYLLSYWLQSTKIIAILSFFHHKNNATVHRSDVGIECDTLLPFLAGKVYWKGVYFAPANSSEKQGNSLLENLDIVNAFEGIKAVKKAPDLLNVTVRDGAFGLQVKELAKPMAIVDSSIVRSRVAGVSIEKSVGHVVMENTTVQNTMFGDGLFYKRLAVDFCSVIPPKVSFPLLLNAVGKALPTNCSQVGVSVVVLY